VGPIDHVRRKVNEPIEVGLTDTFEFVGLLDSLAVREVLPCQGLLLLAIKVDTDLSSVSCHREISVLISPVSCSVWFVPRTTLLEAVTRTSVSIETVASFVLRSVVVFRCVAVVTEACISPSLSICESPFFGVFIDLRRVIDEGPLRLTRKEDCLLDLMFLISSCRHVGPCHC